ncbi:MAG: hypothetical protein ACI3XR_03270 [Eubacteriales bacterium]
MKGKDKCKILKEIRAQIAAANDIEWVTDNCSHKGECRGTCPKCEAEVAKLERELARRKSLGKTVAVAGIAAGMVLSTTSCDLLDLTRQQTAGDFPYSDSERTTASETTTDELIMGAPVFRMFDESDFTPCSPRKFETVRELYAQRVISDGGNETFEEILIPVGDTFEKIGEAEELGFVLVRYLDGNYAVQMSDLNEFTLEIKQTVTQTGNTAPETLPPDTPCTEP